MNTPHAIFDWLIAASFRASLLTIAVFLLQAALQRHLTARMRYALWLPVLIVLLMPVFPQSRWSVETVFAKPPQPVEITLAPIDFSPSAIPVDHSPPSPAPKPIDWQRLFIMAWLTGASGILLFGSISFIITLRRFKRSRHPISDELTITLAQIAREVRLRRIPRVWIASAIHSPAVTGFLRPTLLLPVQFDRFFTPAEARLVLKHELMHLKRHDLPLNAVLCVLMALHWFNPLLWLAFFKARLDREAACDAQVLQNDSADHRREYGHALLKVETAFCPRGLSLGFVGIFQRGAALRSRIHSIATHKRPHALMRAIFIICVTGMTFLGITRAQQPQSPKEDDPLIAIEIKIIEFKQATDWDFGGRLPSKKDSPFNGSLLSQAELNEQLRAEMRKDGINITSYPRMVTLSDKEVLIKSVVNQPYKDKDGQIAHLPIGLVLKLKPSLRDQMINLEIDLTDSELIDPATGAAIAEFTGDHPTARSRMHKTIHETRDGQSSVIAGWDDGKPQSKRPRLYVITPHVIKPEEGGLPGEISLVGDTEKTDNPASKLVDAPALALTTKLQTIILPSVEFRDATLVEAIEFIRAKSREHDPDKKGVNILLKGDGGTVKITLSLKDVPISEALHYCAELANHKLSAYDSTFVLAPAPPKVGTTTSQLKPTNDGVPGANAEAQALAAELRRAKPQQYDFAKADLGDVIRFLATDAGIRFFSLPEDHPTSQRLITFSVRGSPFEVLETICKANNVVLVLEKNVWHVRAADVSALVRKDYPRPGTRIPIKMLLDDLRDLIDSPISDTQPQQLPQHSASFKEDENVVHVVATRIQHRWVAGYLDAVNNGEKRRKERVVRLQSDRISSDTQLGTTTYSGKVTGTVGEITVQAEKVVYEPKACLLLLYPPYTFTQDGKKVVSKEGDVETHTITTADPS